MSGYWSSTPGVVGYDLDVGGSFVHVLDTGRPSSAGSAPVLVFLHGNPTSTFLWRTVVQGLAPDFRCLGVDLIGMGRSGQPESDYTWADHRSFLTAALDALDIGGAPITLVLHDWGVGLGLEYARTHPARIERVVFMEGHLRPYPSWQDFDEGGRELFQRLRTQQGRRMIEQDNFLIETILPGGMNHQLTEAERAAYAEPYPTPGSRHPLWVWTTQIPIAGDPPEPTAVLELNYAWLQWTSTPRLLLHADPGSVLQAEQVAAARQDCPGLAVVGVGAGLHFLPEDQPAATAAAIRSWVVG